MSKNNKSSIMDKMMKFAGVVAKVSEIPAIKAIQDGMIATMAPILIGSIFLILSLLGTPSIGDSGSAILPFLEPLASKFAIVNTMTLGFVGLYASFCISKAYGKHLKLDTTQSGLMGLLGFFFITFNGADKSAMISTTYFGTNGLFVAMIVSLISIKIYSLFVKNNFTIRLPKSVPPNVGNAFASLVPMTVVISICWVIRSVIGFDFPEFLSTFLTPLLGATDNLWGYSFITLLVVLLWSIGLNGPGMLAAIITPITTANLTANAAAKVAGNALPHIWTNSFQYSFIWVGSVFPVVIWYIISKNKGKKALGIASAPALFFNIVEPSMFGAPISMNPILMIPFIFNGVVGCAIGYISVMIGFVARPFAEVPWATPAPISGVMITGDWKILIVQLIVLIFGVVTYYPFIKMDISNSEKVSSES
ncbi:PTS sugar transporter subunit IIC [Dellaglioa sp. L3N]